MLGPWAELAHVLQDILPPKAVQALAGVPQAEALLRCALKRQPGERPSLAALASRCACRV